MLRNSFSSLVLVGAVGAVACSNDSTPRASDAGLDSSVKTVEAGTGTGGKTGSGGSSAAGASGAGGSATSDAGDAGGSVTLTGSAVVAVPGHLGKEAPLAGVSLCVVDDKLTKKPGFACTTTDSSGKFTMTFAPNQRLIVELSKAGYASQILAVDVGTADADRGSVRLSPAAGDAGDAGDVVFGWDPSIVFDPTKGSTDLVAVTPSGSPDAGTAVPGFDFAVGVSFTISPKGGDGPFYVATDETWASGATSTVGGYGAWFLNLTPGTYTGKATSPTMTCQGVSGNGYGWANKDGTSSFPILTAVTTQSVLFYCVPKATDAGHD